MALLIRPTTKMFGLLGKKARAAGGYSVDGREQ